MNESSSFQSLPKRSPAGRWRSERERDGREGQCTPEINQAGHYKNLWTGPPKSKEAGVLITSHYQPSAFESLTWGPSSLAPPASLVWAEHTSGGKWQMLRGYECPPTTLATLWDWKGRRGQERSGGKRPQTCLWDKRKDLRAVPSNCTESTQTPRVRYVKMVMPGIRALWVRGPG